jgi:O-antigen/teichoic acid export membrane protein
MMSQRRGIFRNTVLSAAGRAVPLVVGVVAMPFVAGGLGPDRFGILSLCWALLGYFTVFDVGVGRATTKFVAEAWSHRAHESARHMIYTAVALQLGLGVLGAVALASASRPVAGQLLNIPAGLVHEATAAFRLLAWSLPCLLVATALRGALEAAHRFDLVSAVRVPSASSLFLIPLAAPLLGADLRSVVGMLALAQLATAAVYGGLVMRIFRLGPPVAPTPASARRLLAYAGWVAVSSAVEPLLVSAERFLLGVVHSIAAVGYYGAPHDAITRLTILPASLAAVLFPAFSSQGRSLTARHAELYSRATQLLAMSVVPLAAVTIVFARELLDAWLGPAFAQEATPALQILAIGVALNSIAYVPFALIQGLGRPDLTAKFHLLEVGPYLVLAWYLVSEIGITGAAAAWTIRVTADAGLLFWGASRLTGTGAARDRSGQVTLALTLGATLAAWAVTALVAAPSARITVFLVAIVAAAPLLRRYRSAVACLQAASALPEGVSRRPSGGPVLS